MATAGTAWDWRSHSSSPAFWAQATPASRVGAVALVLAIPLLVVAVGWDSLLIRLGIRLTWPDVYARLIAAPWRQIGSLATAIAIAPLPAPCCSSDG